MKRLASKMIKAVLRKRGYEVRKTELSPLHRLLGAANLPVRTIVDVGANEGQFARFISGYFPQAAIYCFEPVPEAFVSLRTWANTQNGRATAINCALGEVAGCFEMIKHDLHTSSSSFLKTTSRCEHYYPQTKTKSVIQVECQTLDLAMELNCKALEPDILIKLDVQGFEDRVIRGGKQTFLRSSVAILEVSLVPLYESQPMFPKIIGLMEELNFDYGGNLEQTCSQNGALLSVDAVFFRRR